MHLCQPYVDAFRPKEFQRSGFELHDEMSAANDADEDHIIHIIHTYKCPSLRFEYQNCSRKAICMIRGDAVPEI